MFPASPPTSSGRARPGLCSPVVDRALSRCHRSWRARLRVSAIVCAASVAAVVTGGAAFSASRSTRNYTPSLPLGVYWLRPRLPITKGALVDFPIPPEARALIADRYLPARFHLLKRVVALEGDIVCLTDGRFFVDGVPISTIARRDSIGRPLAAFEFCGPVTPGTAFVATPVPSSLDSRYFGPVPLSVLTVATPLWTS
jgi:conjugative transfer signal peptidase TraF